MLHVAHWQAKYEDIFWGEIFFGNHPWNVLLIFFGIGEKTSLFIFSTKKNFTVSNIARELYTCEVPTKRGGKWSQKQVSRILKWLD